MRIVHVAPTLFGSGGILGGGERYPLELARALAREVDCRLVTFGPPARIREPGGLRIEVLRPAWWTGGHPANPVAFRLPAALARADVVHTHHLKSVPSRMAAVTAKLLGRRTAATDHGLPGGDWGGLLPRLFDRFLLVSGHSARLLGTPPERTRLVYGGADPDRFLPGPEPRRGVLFVGRITPHKGVDVLIRALPPGVPLTVAGSEGHDRRRPEREYPTLLRRLAAGREVTFAGPVPERDLPALLRTAAVLALPSVRRTCYGRDMAISELLGLVALEAMASGTPVVASRIGGLPEIVRDGHTGLLVEPGDEAALRDALHRVVSDGALGRRMGRAGRELVLDRFTWKHVAERCLAAYEEVAAGS